MEIKILIVDDDVWMTKVLSKIISNIDNTEVFIALDGFDAVATALKEKPNLIFLDLMMPEMDGITTLKLLKTIPHTANSKVIICSGANDMDHLTKVIKLGAKFRNLRGENTPQSVAAKNLGVSQRTYANYERGDRAPAFSFIKNVVRYYRITYDWLFDGEGAPTNESMRTEIMFLQSQLNHLRNLFSAGVNASAINIPQHNYYGSSQVINSSQSGSITMNNVPPEYFEKRPRGRPPKTGVPSSSAPSSAPPTAPSPAESVGGKRPVGRPRKIDNQI